MILNPTGQGHPSFSMEQAAVLLDDAPTCADAGMMAGKSHPNTWDGTPCQHPARCPTRS